MTRPKRRPLALLVAVGLALATLAVYESVAGLGFVSYDDPEYVAANPLVQRGLTAGGVRFAFTGVHHGNWHPVTTLSNLLDVELFGVEAGAMHRVNLGLHVANALLLFFLLLRTTGALGASAFAAALFALHPLRVESVAWIAERKDVLSGFFGLATAHAYVGYARSPRAGRYAAVLGLFSLGLMSKPVLVTWPFVLLLLDAWPLRRLDGPRGIRRAALEKLPLLVLAAIASALTLWAQAEGGALRAVEVRPWLDRVQLAILAYVHYLRATVVPVDLAVLYPVPESLSAWRVAASAALLGAISVACLRARRSQPYALMGWLWYLGTLVPVIGLVPVGAQAWADRYTYLPSIGIGIAVVWSAEAALRRLGTRARTAGVGLAAVALLLLSLLAWRQVAVWRDSVSLYRHALEVTERNAVIHNNLGIALTDAGRLDEALRVYADGLAFPSLFVHQLSYNAGLAHLRAGRPADALPLLDTAIRIQPDHPEALFHRGRALASLNRVEEARLSLERAVALAPEQAEPRLELGLVLGKLGRVEDAKRAFMRAVELAPLLIDSRINLAIAHLKTGDREAAVAELERVLAIRPGHAAAQRYLERARSQPREP